MIVETAALQMGSIMSFEAAVARDYGVPETEDLAAKLRGYRTGGIKTLFYVHDSEIAGRINVYSPSFPISHTNASVLSTSDLIIRDIIDPSVDIDHIIPPWAVNVFYLGDFYVRPEYRNKGVGTRLFGKALEEINETTQDIVCVTDSETVLKMARLLSQEKKFAYHEGRYAGYYSDGSSIVGMKPSSRNYEGFEVVFIYDDIPGKFISYNSPSLTVGRVNGVTLFVTINECTDYVFCDRGKYPGQSVTILSPALAGDEIRSAVYEAQALSGHLYHNIIQKLPNTLSKRIPRFSVAQLMGKQVNFEDRLNESIFSMSRSKRL
jgi:GNAT superfamily N-acetyltransferase